MAGVVEDEWIEKLMKTCTTDSYEKLSDFLTSMMVEGYSANQVRTYICSTVQYAVYFLHQ